MVTRPVTAVASFAARTAPSGRRPHFRSLTQSAIGPRSSAPPQRAGRSGGSAPTGAARVTPRSPRRSDAREPSRRRGSVGADPLVRPADALPSCRTPSPALLGRAASIERRPARTVVARARSLGGSRPPPAGRTRGAARPGRAVEPTSHAPSRVGAGGSGDPPLRRDEHPPHAAARRLPHPRNRITNPPPASAVTRRIGERAYPTEGPRNIDDELRASGRRIQQEKRKGAPIAAKRAIDVTASASQQSA